MTRKELPSQSELKALFNYDPLTGALTWKARETVNSKTQSWNTRYADKPALATKNANGYLHGTLRGRTISAHRIIFKIMTDQDPHEIDHIDGNRQNNAFANLRSVTRLENRRNQGVRACNTSGATGVTWDKARNKWRAQITDNREVINRGRVAAFEDAVSARRDGERKMGFHPNHGSRPCSAR